MIVRIPDESERLWKGTVMPAAYFPLFINLEGRDVLVAGAGKVASRRAGMLLSFGAEVTVVAPKAERQIRDLHDAGKICWLQRPVEGQDVEGRALVVAATNDAACNDELARICREKKIPVNHAGNSALCDFYFPGIARRDYLVIGVTASGRDHHLAKEVSTKLRSWLNSLIF